MVKKVSDKEFAAFMTELGKIKIGPSNEEFAAKQAKLTAAAANTPSVEVGPGTNTSGGLAYRGGKPAEERLAEITKPQKRNPNASAKYLGRDTLAQLDALVTQPIPTANALASSIKFTAASKEDDLGMSAFGLSANVALRDDDSMLKSLPYTEIAGLRKIHHIPMPKFKERPVKMVNIAKPISTKHKPQKPKPARVAYNPHTGRHELTRSKSLNPILERLYTQLAAKIK